MIETQNLTKSFKIKGKKKKIVAVNNLNLNICEGEIFGIIGPNGAGKTTLLKILSTLILPDGGSVKIDGFDVVKDADAVKSRVGLLAGEFTRSFYWRLSGRNNLKFFANLKNMWNPEERIDELIDLFGLSDHADELVMKYSTGMKHKLALATGLLDNPPVIFLDEPLAGIDPESSYEIKKLIKNEFKEKTIIWTTHNLFEMEEMCDRIALLNKGKIILQGKPDEIKKNYWDYEKIMVVSDKPNAFKDVQRVEIKEDVVIIETRDTKNTFLEILKIIQQKNVDIKDIKTLKPSLEEITMKVIKNAR